MTEQIRPHGGILINREVSHEERAFLQSGVSELPKLPIDAWTASDIECIATGVFSPLTGFMNQEEYNAVLTQLRLPQGLVWTLPITLPIKEELARTIYYGERVALVNAEGKALAILTVTDIFQPDKEKEAAFVYGTTDPSHPGVAKLRARASMYVGGPIDVLESRGSSSFQELSFTPQDTRRLFRELGWETVVGFQTRNPIHRAHEYIQKSALENVDGLFIHPLVGETKADDIPAKLRVESYKVLVEQYFPKDRVVLGIYPAAMRYAGPREAIHHAIVRKNYGCTHFIVGRDHAGVGNYYGPYDAQELFKAFTKEELGITPLFYEHSFYCTSCQGMATYKTCPHGEAFQLKLSGTQVREKLRNGEILPPEFTRPEVAQILRQGMSGYYSPHQQGKAISASYKR